MKLANYARQIKTLSTQIFYLSFIIALFKNKQ